MHNLKLIRQLLGLTQRALGDVLGCTQGNIAQYEGGQTFPPSMAKNLIDFAAGFGVALSYDHIYGGKPLPKHKEAA